MHKKLSAFLLVVLITSCNSNSNVIKVTYEIKEMRDWSFDATFTVNNTSGVELNSPWSLHWNQQSSMVDSDKIPENIIYDYVGGQSYNILSFGNNYVLPNQSSFSIDIGQTGVVRRVSDLPVGGFITTIDDVVDVEFEYIWKNAKGIENSSITFFVSCINCYISNSLYYLYSRIASIHKRI